MSSIGMLLKKNTMLQNKAASLILFSLCIPLVLFGQQIGLHSENNKIFALDAIVQLQHYEELTSFITNKNPQKIKIVNFWATWCKPCVRELSLFELYFQKNQEKAEVYLISLDKLDDIDKLAEFLGKREISTHVGLFFDKNYNDWIGKVNSEWSGAIPATLVIINNKKYFFEREFDNYADLESAINQSINASK